MDQHKALNILLESADIISMLEELTNTASKNGLASSSIAGMRVTLRNLREQILASHDSLAQIALSRARNAENTMVQAAPAQQRDSIIVGGRAGDINGSARSSTASSEIAGLPRKDLRAAIEKVLDRP